MPKRKKIKLYKFDIGTLDHVRVVGSKNGKNVIIAELQRKRPTYLTRKIFPLKKNPEKITFHQEKNNPFGLQIFTYKTNPNWIFIARNGLLISIEAEKIPEILESFKKASKYFEEQGII